MNSKKILGILFVFSLLSLTSNAEGEKNFWGKDYEEFKTDVVDLDGGVVRYQVEDDSTVVKSFDELLEKEVIKNNIEVQKMKDKEEIIFLENNINKMQKLVKKLKSKDYSKKKELEVKKDKIYLEINKIEAELDNLKLNLKTLRKEIKNLK